MAEAENILSPEELDALSSGIEDGSIEAGAGLNISARAVKHDIVKKDSSKGVNVDVINAVNTRFLSKFKNELSTVFRTEVKGAAREVKLMPYHEYCEMATAPSASNVIKLKPLHGNSLVVIDPAIIFRCFDSFFGGTGDREQELLPSRIFTSTEVSINNILMNITFDALKQAWLILQPVDPSSVSMSNNARSVLVSDDNDLVLLSRIVLTWGEDESGTVDIVYPYYALKTIRESLIRPSSDEEKDDIATKWTEDLQGAVLDSELAVKVVLAQIDTTLKAVELMGEEQVLYFAKPKYARLDVEGVPFFQGNVGTQSSNMAFQIVNGKPK